MSILRTAAQAIVGGAASWLAAHAVAWPEADRERLIGVMVLAGIVVWTAVVRWLETRDNAVARMLGRILMFGLQDQPVYVKPNEVPTLGGTTPPRRE